MPTPPRYRLERAQTVEALQDRLEPLLERLSLDREAGDAAVSAASSYTPAVAADWSGDAPATVAEALDRIAAALGPIA